MLFGYLKGKQKGDLKRKKKLAFVCMGLLSYSLPNGRMGRYPPPSSKSLSHPDRHSNPLSPHIRRAATTHFVHYIVSATFDRSWSTLPNTALREDDFQVWKRYEPRKDTKTYITIH